MPAAPHLKRESEGGPGPSTCLSPAEVGRMNEASSEEPFNVVEASIEDLRTALESNRVTCVDLVAQYLQRIGKYDCRGPMLNSIPLLNPNVFDEAAASDDRRASGRKLGPFDGIPYTAKDSYKVKGMTVACGSPAFQELQANEDAFMISKLREAGAVLIGKTNMPPMAYGGMQRGVYGRAENPYNPEYLAAAFGSGSSNGSAVSTAASFAAFGMAEETVSSGRSPASNNGLVAYTPSRGFLSIRGNWPLYPTCDVVVPQTRTMRDMLELLDVIAVKDDTTRGDFWRDQLFIKLPEPWVAKPESFKELIGTKSLQGLRIAVPSCYIGGDQLAGALSPVYTAPETIALWEQARQKLEEAGAEIIIVPDFPAVRYYENPDHLTASDLDAYPPLRRLPQGWNAVERGPLIAHAWDEFLRQNNDSNIPRLEAVDTDRIFPAVPPDHPQIKYTEASNAIIWCELKSHLQIFPAPSRGPPGTISAITDMANAMGTLDTLREGLLDSWMAGRFDLVVFPAAGDVARSDADVSHSSAQHAWTNGVKYSNGNRALRHLAIPSVTVPIGVLDGKGVPLGLTICSSSYSDQDLLAYAVEFEKVLPKRSAPTSTPRLDLLDHTPFGAIVHERPELSIEQCTKTKRERKGSADVLCISVKGTVLFKVPAGCGCSAEIQVFVDAAHQPLTNIKGGQRGEIFSCTFDCQAIVDLPPAPDARNKTEARIPRDQTMVVVLARYRLRKDDEVTTSRPSGFLRLVP